MDEAEWRKRERQRIRESECLSYGHRLREELAEQSIEPVGLVCSCCGRRWAVTDGRGGLQMPDWDETLAELRRTMPPR